MRSDKKPCEKMKRLSWKKSITSSIWALGFNFFTEQDKQQLEGNQGIPALIQVGTRKSQRRRFGSRATRRSPPRSCCHFVTGHLIAMRTQKGQNSPERGQRAEAVRGAEQVRNINSSRCSKPHPALPGTIPGMGQPQLLRKSQK